MKNRNTFLMIMTLVMLFSCETPEDSVIKAVYETNNKLNK